eukprot:1580992-Rhodomonas_salina.1
MAHLLLCVDLTGRLEFVSQVMEVRGPAPQAAPEGGAFMALLPRRVQGSGLGFTSYCFCAISCARRRQGVEEEKSGGNQTPGERGRQGRGGGVAWIADVTSGRPNALALLISEVVSDAARRFVRHVPEQPPVSPRPAPRLRVGQDPALCQVRGQLESKLCAVRASCLAASTQPWHAAPALVIVDVGHVALTGTSLRCRSRTAWPRITSPKSSTSPSSQVSTSDPPCPLALSSSLRCALLRLGPDLHGSSERARVRASTQRFHRSTKVCVPISAFASSPGRRVLGQCTLAAPSWTRGDEKRDLEWMKLGRGGEGSDGEQRRGGQRMKCTMVLRADQGEREGERGWGQGERECARQRETRR